MEQKTAQKLSTTVKSHGGVNVHSETIQAKKGVFSKTKKTINLDFDFLNQLIATCKFRYGDTNSPLQSHNYPFINSDLSEYILRREYVGKSIKLSLITWFNDPNMIVDSKVFIIFARWALKCYDKKFIQSERLTIGSFLRGKLDKTEREFEPYHGLVESIISSPIADAVYSKMSMLNQAPRFHILCTGADDLFVCGENRGNVIYFNDDDITITDIYGVKLSLAYIATLFSRKVNIKPKDFLYESKTDEEIQEHLKSLNDVSCNINFDKIVDDISNNVVSGPPEPLPPVEERKYYIPLNGFVSQFNLDHTYIN